MKGKKVFIGLLAITLALGMALAGCDSGNSPGGGGGSGGIPQVPSWAQGRWYLSENPYPSMGNTRSSKYQATSTQLILSSPTIVDSTFTGGYTEVYRYDCSGSSGDTVTFANAYSLRQHETSGRIYLGAGSSWTTLYR